jgi:hypothetical protein
MGKTLSGTLTAPAAFTEWIPNNSAALAAAPANHFPALR